jgi:hypothetical protein
LGEPGAQVTLLDYLGAIDALIVRRDALEAAIGELVPGSLWAQTVARLRCLRGIDTLSAVGLCAEIGDWERFQRPGAADELPRCRALRELKRRETPPGRDHKVGVSSRPAAAGRRCLALLTGPAPRRSSRRREQTWPPRARAPTIPL